MLFDCVVVYAWRCDGVLCGVSRVVDSVRACSSLAGLSGGAGRTGEEGGSREQVFIDGHVLVTTHKKNNK